MRGSIPDCVLGNGITSRIDGCFSISATNLSIPIAKPACCGVPYESASINHPNLFSISSAESPHFSRTNLCISGEFILCEPEPS